MWFFPDEQLPCISFYRYLKGDGNRAQCRSTRCTYAHCESLINSNGEINYNPPSHETTSLMKIVLELMQAKRTIDICVYSLTYKELVEVLLFLKNRRAIKLRVITDSSSDNPNDQINNLRESGVHVREKAMDLKKMHHKCVLIDNKVLLIGSFNWTHSAICRNDESVLKTKQHKIVKQWADHFNKLWREL